MKTKKHIILVICIMITQVIISQNEPTKTKKDIIEFNDGTTKQGNIWLGGIGNATKNGKVQLCDENFKNCKKYKRSTINKIITFRGNGEVEYYKILYLKRKNNRPLVSKLIFEGDNYDFYSFSTSMTDSNTLNTFSSVFIYAVNKNSNQIKYRFQHKKIKKSIKELNDIFTNCTAIKVELKKKKKILNKKPLEYYLKIADKCSLD